MDRYPSDHSPLYLRSRLADISDPGDMADSLAALEVEDDRLQQRVDAGKLRYDRLQEQRSKCESNLADLIKKYEHDLNNLSQSLLTSDWAPESCDEMMKQIKV